ncbi:minor tail protein [Mycobacterium phage Brocalys]|uniref:minor tail protein n=1 Tax=Mycobacterium phage Brocalys TaxID=1815608 RepID=UPI00078C3031|nr:minor tail protein [Mycobacterium phage Brocalys]AMS01735.1 hypothetical protein SEA_BROCALYS_28 [Mycobacterium phage Brocalys]
MIWESVREAVDAAYQPDDGIDLIGLLIIGLPSTIAAIGTGIVGVLTVRGQRKGRERARQIDAKTDEIHEQTVNTHDTNMRDDLDEIRDLVRDGFKQVQRDIGGLREELRTERLERIEGDKRRDR